MNWRQACALFIIIIGLSPSQNALAGLGPQNIAVVVNPNDPDSLAVANAYVELRGIPPTNVLYIPWNAEAARTTAIQFRNRLLKPLLDQIKQNGIEPQIEAVAFSTGYPYLVDCAPLYPGQEFPRQAKPWASLTSATYLHGLVTASSPQLFTLNTNAYFAPVVEGRTASRAFRATFTVGQGGQTAAATVKLPYLMATSLGVTHGGPRGSKAAEIIAALQRAKQADGTKPKGTVYYMQNNDVRSRARHDQFPAAIRELTALGVKAVLLNGAVPAGKQDIAGLTTGSPTLGLRSSNCKFLPGALSDNLTSGAGQFIIPPTAPRPQTPISEFLRAGVTGASGCVVEPMAIPEKFPSPHLHVHYARGCSLAEAFYQSVAGPAQLLIVGDPLCQPWAAPPKVSVAGVSEGEPLKGNVPITPTAKYSDRRAASRFELYVDGLRKNAIGPGEKFDLATAALADGWHELRVVAIDNTPIAVQGVWAGSVQVKNGGDAVQLSAPGSNRVALSGTLNLQVTSTGNEDAAVFHNNRRLGVVPGGSGKLAVDAAQLGRGRIELYVRQASKPALRSKPLAVEVY